MIQITSNIQVSSKLADGRIFVIGGESATEFQANAVDILGTENAMDLIDQFKLALMGNGGALEMAVNNVVQAFPTPAATTSAAAPGQSAPTTNTETDKWGGVWTYGLPNAPSCPHGLRVQKKATSQAGKPYTAWVCPTHSPLAYRQKVSKDASCQMEFAR